MVYGYLLVAWWYSMAMLNNQEVTWYQITHINPWFPGLEKRFIWNDPMNKQQTVKPPTSWRCNRILPFGMFFLVLCRKPDSHGRCGRNRTSQFLSESISEHNQKWWMESETSHEVMKSATNTPNGLTQPYSFRENLPSSSAFALLDLRKEFRDHKPTLFWKKQEQQTSPN